MDTSELAQLLDNFQPTDEVALSRLQILVAEALKNATVDEAAAVVAELGRWNQRHDSELSAPSLESLLGDARAALDRAMFDRAKSERANQTRTLADEILNEIRPAPLGPGDLADRLGVHISQVSRAGRLLEETDRITIAVGPNDGRSRLYVHAGRPKSKRRLADLVGRLLPKLSLASIRSDLVPDRLGDRLSPAGRAQVLDAVRQEVELDEYRPGPMHEVRIAKEGGGTRPGAAPSFADRAVFAALVEQCREPIDSALAADESVLWPSGYSSPKDWKRLEHFATSTNKPYIVSLDVQSFYETIRHDVLADRLQSVNCDTQVVGALTDLLTSMAGRSRGLPQGLEPSDALAGIFLAPLDQILHENAVPFVRHGDDLRCAVRTPGEADEVIDLTRNCLQSLDLLINDGKTRTLTRDTYVRTRNAVQESVREFAAKRGTAEGHHVLHDLLVALDADEDLQWGWYHGSLSITDVIDLSHGVSDGDRNAIIALLDGVLMEQRQKESMRPSPKDPGARFLTRTGLELMTDLRMTPPIALDIRELTEPDYEDVLPTYLSALAHADPDSALKLLDQIAHFPDQNGLWLRVYEGINDVSTGTFNDIAAGHLRNASDAAVRVRAARFVAGRDASVDIEPDFAATAPLALRADALEACRPSGPATETPTTKALLSAA